MHGNRMTNHTSNPWLQGAEFTRVKATISEFSSRSRDPSTATAHPSLAYTPFRRTAIPTDSARRQIHRDLHPKPPLHLAPSLPVSELVARIHRAPPSCRRTTTTTTRCVGASPSPTLLCTDASRANSSPTSSSPSSALCSSH